MTTFQQKVVEPVMTPGTEVMNQVQYKSMEAEPEIPRTEVDASGQAWRVYSDGRRLKSGNPQATGRPKKEVIQDYVNLGGKEAYEWAKRVLRSGNYSDDSPVMIQAVKIVLDIGIGKQTRVEMQDRQAVLQALARATMDKNVGLTDTQAAKLLERMADELGIE